MHKIIKVLILIAVLFPFFFSVYSFAENPIQAIDANSLQTLAIIAGITIFIAVFVGYLVDNLMGCCSSGSMPSRTLEDSDLLRKLIDYSNDAFYVLDPRTGKFLDVNSKACGSLGYNCNELLSMCIVDVEMKFQDLSAWKTHVIEIKQKGSEIIEGVHKRKDGTVFPVEANVRFVPHGKAGYVIAVARDISDRKKAQNELVSLESSYATLVANLNIGVYRNTSGPHGKFLRANLALVDIFGYDSTEEFMSVMVSDLYQSPEDRQAFIEKIGQEGMVKDEVLYLKKKDNTPIVASCTARAHYDEKGDILWIDGVLEDITERKKLDDQLKRLSTAVEQSANTVVMTDLDGAIIYVNRAFEQSTGYSSDEALGQNPRILKSGHQSDDVYKNLWDTISSGGIWKGEFRNKKKNGEFYWENALITPVKDESGKPIAYIAIKEDITQKKRLESDLARLASFPALNPNPIIEMAISGEVIYANPAATTLFSGIKSAESTHPIVLDLRSVIKELESAKQSTFLRGTTVGERYYEQHISYVVMSKTIRAYIIDITERKKMESLKDDFVRNVSHELRTPMTTIREVISQMRDGILGETTEKQRHFLDISLEDVDRLKRVVDNLLDISRIESGRVKLNRELVDINRLILAVCSNFDPLAQKKEVEIIPKLPDEMLEVYIDQDRIIQVFTNLIGNALKFTEKGSIEISVTSKKDFIECRVSDTGKGIPEQSIGHIFSKFYQIERTAGGAEQGTGLGLPIVKELVVAHGGSINVESAVDEGTKFTFTLPKYTIQQVVVEKVSSLISSSGEGQPIGLSLFMLEGLQKISDQVKLFKVISNTSRLAIGDLRSFDINIVRGRSFFYLIIQGVSSSQLEAALSKGLESINKYLAKDEETKEIKVSYRFVGFPEDARDADELLTKLNQRRA